MPINESDLASPCTSVCELNYDRSLCTGCFRTLDEIARWATMSPSQKREVLDRVESRRSSSD